MDKIKYIVVHGALTHPGMNIGWEHVDQWHRAKGWKMGGYHFVIRRDGTEEEGRPLSMPGAHAPPVQRESIAILLAGGLKAGTGDVWDCNYTIAQYRTLEGLCYRLIRQFGDHVKVVGHRDVQAGRQCPGFDVEAWWSKG